MPGYPAKWRSLGMWPKELRKTVSTAALSARSRNGPSFWRAADQRDCAHDLPERTKGQGNRSHPLLQIDDIRQQRGIRATVSRESYRRRRAIGIDIELIRTVKQPFDDAVDVRGHPSHCLLGDSPDIIDERGLADRSAERRQLVPHFNMFARPISCVIRHVSAHLDETKPFACSPGRSA